MFRSGKVDFVRSFSLYSLPKIKENYLKVIQRSQKLERIYSVQAMAINCKSTLPGLTNYLIMFPIMSVLI